MNNKKFPRGLKVYLPLVFMFVLFVFLLPRSPRFNYEYKKGDHWMYETLVAEFDFPILKTEEELKAEKDAERKNWIPYFRQQDKVLSTIIQNLEGLPLQGYESLVPTLKTTLHDIYSKGVFDPNDSHLYLDVPAKVAYVQKKNSSEKKTVPISEIFTVEKARTHLRASLSQFETEIADSLYSALELYDLVLPDMEYDQEMTEELHSDRVHHISHTKNYVSRSETIVEKGEMITDDIANLLDSYKAEFNKSVAYSGTMLSMWSGLSMVSLLLVVLFFFTLYFCNYRIFSEYNKYLYVLILYVMFCIITFMVARKDIEMYYMIPYSLMSMFMMAFFRKGFVMIMYCITLIPILIVAPGNVDVFFMHLTAGFLGLYVYHTLNRGWLQFVGSFIIFLIMVAVWMGFCLIFDNVGNWHLLLYIALSAGLAIAGYPLIYLFERVFALVSSAKLVELSDTSNALLRLLADKAPGTFHHSLQVMNIADAAARAINANVPLIRAAALYHDIGKIKNPQCFTENEIPGVKVHEGLTPKESAALITRHVTDGLELAEKHKLPRVLKDFIISHHGTTSASYFLTKYLNDGGDPKETGEFYYDGMKPATKEQVILMLSDAVEAASRSLKDYSTESISNLVDRIFDAKASEGQFTDADISLRELNTINEVMKSFVQQVYHSRIEYPKRVVPAK